MQQQIRAAQNGSQRDLGQLLDGCRQYLLLIANQELHADLHAKVAPSDLVQETFLEAQRDFDRFEGDSEDELLVWLKQILLNNIRDAVRRYRTASMRNVAREVSLPGQDSSVAVPDEKVTTETPSWLARLRERDEFLREALERLSDDHRRVIVLRNLELRSFVEIGRAMGRTPDAVRKLWVRALEILQRELGEFNGR